MVLRRTLPPQETEKGKRFDQLSQQDKDTILVFYKCTPAEARWYVYTTDCFGSYLVRTLKRL